MEEHAFDIRLSSIERWMETMSRSMERLTEATQQLAVHAMQIHSHNERMTDLERSAALTSNRCAVIETLAEQNSTRLAALERDSKNNERNVTRLLAWAAVLAPICLLLAGAALNWRATQ